MQTKLTFSSILGVLTLVGALTIPAPVLRAGNLYVGTAVGDQILRFTPGGASSIFATGLNNPAALAFDSRGNLFEADSHYPDFGTGAVYEFAPNGTRTTIDTGLVSPDVVAVDASGNIFVGDTGALTIYKYTPGGARTTFATGVYSQSFAFDPQGNLLASDPYPGGLNTGSSVIDEYSPSGAHTVFASGGFFYPIGLAIDGTGNLYTPISNGNIVKFTPGGTMSTFSFCGACLYLAFDGQGNLFASDGNAGNVYEYTPGGVRSTFASGLAYPQGLAFSTAPEPTAGLLLATGLVALLSLRRGTRPHETSDGTTRAIPSPWISRRP